MLLCSCMQIVRRARLTLPIFVVGVFFQSLAPEARAQWPQWGGAHQDFKAECKGLADKWPDEGPRKVWSRDLGDGYSGIIADAGILYTMYRNGDDQEVVIALDAETGKTKWEHQYDAPPKPGHVTEFGTGPRATPTLDGERLYTIGVAGHMHCLDRKNGKVHWSHQLWDEYKGTFLMHGYSSSPYIYKNLVITLVGGEGHAVVAFDKLTGKEVWKMHDFGNSYATPKLIRVDGEDQLACFMGSEIIGIEPMTGDLKWRFEHKNQWSQNICPPIYDNDHMLFISSPEPACSKGLRLTRKGDKTQVEEVWMNRKVRVHHSNAVRVGDSVYCSSGDGPGLFFAVDAKSGDLKWRKRGFAKSTVLYADGKFILLDEDGKLGLVRATPEDFDILAQAQVLERVSWTVPTLIGTRLYLRDKKHMIALELGRDAYTAAQPSPRDRG